MTPRSRKTPRTPPSARKIEVTEGARLPDDGRCWRYLEMGRSRHVLASPDHVMATCGVSPRGWFASSGDWRGTGSQREYEVNAALPACRKCCQRLRIEPTVTERRPT